MMFFLKLSMRWIIIKFSIFLSAFFLATLSLGLPGAPAALGTVHYAIIAATIPFGVEYAVALNYAVLMHLSYFLVLVFGSSFLYILTAPPTGFKEISIGEIILKLKSGWTS